MTQHNDPETSNEASTSKEVQIPQFSPELAGRTIPLKVVSIAAIMSSVQHGAVDAVDAKKACEISHRFILSDLAEIFGPKRVEQIQHETRDEVTAWLNACAPDAAIGEGYATVYVEALARAIERALNEAQTSEVHQGSLKKF